MTEGCWSLENQILCRQSSPDHELGPHRLKHALILGHNINIISLATLLGNSHPIPAASPITVQLFPENQGKFSYDSVAREMMATTCLKAYVKHVC